MILYRIEPTSLTIQQNCSTMEGHTTFVVHFTCTPVRIMSNAGLNSENVVNSVDIFNHSVVINDNEKEQYWDEQCFLQIFLG